MWNQYSIATAEVSSISSLTTAYRPACLAPWPGTVSKKATDLIIRLSLLAKGPRLPGIHAWRCGGDYHQILPLDSLASCS